MSDERERRVVVPSGCSASLERVLDRVRAAGEALRRTADERVIRAIAGAAARLADPTSPEGAEARASIPARSRLSEPNVEHALVTTLAELREDKLHAALSELQRAYGHRKATPVSLAGFVLAGNVFTAVLRPLAWALLARVPVAIKPSSDDEGLAELFAAALAKADSELGQAVAICRFDRHQPEMLDSMARRCDVIHAWGSDRSLAAIRAAIPATTAFFGHGSGLGAAYVPAAALESEASVEQVVLAIALDVVLYDQRGCLSPHFVLVGRGAPIGGRELARLLAERGLGVWTRKIPRGPLPLAVSALQMQWRGVAAVRGELYEGEGWAVSYEGDHPLRLSPGYRNIAVYECGGADELGTRLAAFGVHLKALGVAGPPEVRCEIARALPPPLAPRISAVGAMQTPSLLASADGEPPWAGLLRWRDVD